jgi:hypothetical protein
MKNFYFIKTRENGTSKYETRFFELAVFPKGVDPLATFIGEGEAFATFISRENAADLLRRKFKNHIERRLDRSTKKD